MAKNDMPHVIKVMIVDDHPVVREGLRVRLSQHKDLQVCAETGDVGEALQLLEQHEPDVAVIDISLKTGNGLDLIRRIRTHGNDLPILVWSMYNENLYAERALRAGALGYINKENATDQIISAIRRVLEGKVYLSPTMSDQLLNRAVGTKSDGLPPLPIEVLSDRELQVFQFIGEGLDTQRIAERMFVSPKTIETYRTRIKNKLHLTSGLELIQRAIQSRMQEAEPTR